MAVLDQTLHVGVGTYVGGLTVFPVWVEPARPEPAPQILPTRREVPTAIAVEELASPSVPRLLLRNRSGSPVVVLEGETLPGGLQDRTLNVTVVVAAGEGLAVPVSCIEQGRWGLGGARPRSGHTSPNLRAQKNRAVASSREHGSWASDQGAVWREVERLRISHRAWAPSGSFLDVRDQVVSRVGATIRSVRPLEGQRGILFGIGGEARALDVFERPQALAAYWDDLVEAALIDAAVERPVKTGGSAARRFVREVARTTLVSAPSVGMGQDIRGDRDGLTVSGIRVDRRLVHLSALREVAA